MRKNICISVLVLVLLGGVNCFAGEWEYSGLVSASYNETHVSSNWSGSEQNSKSWMMKGDFRAGKESDVLSRRNTFKAEYGQSSVSGSPSQITADFIDMESIFMRKFNLYVNPYAAASLISQFNEFFDPVVSGQSLGLGWQLIKKENQDLSLRLGGALKQTFESSERPVYDSGAESAVNYSMDFGSGRKFVSELKIFTPFDGSADLRWDSSLYVKLREYLSASLGYLALLGPEPQSFPEDVQTRVTTGLAFSFNLL
ncbi:MAG: DUF481 domain-containing protein [Elusimicrobiota bacterium]